MKEGIGHFFSLLDRLVPANPPSDALQELHIRRVLRSSTKKIIYIGIGGIAAPFLNLISRCKKSFNLCLRAPTGNRLNN
jgi:hypothetical protein